MLKWWWIMRIPSFWDMMLHPSVTRSLLGHLDLSRLGHCIALEYQDPITCWCIIISSATPLWKTWNSWLMIFIYLYVREFTVSLRVQHTKPNVPEGKKHCMWLEVQFLTNDNEISFKGWIFHINSTVVTLTANACFVHSQNKGSILPSQSEAGNVQDTSEFPEVNGLTWI